MPWPPSQQTQRDNFYQAQQTADTEQSGFTTKLNTSNRLDTSVSKLRSGSTNSSKQVLTVDHNVTPRTAIHSSSCQGLRSVIRQHQSANRASFRTLLLLSFVCLSVADSSATCPVSIEYAASLGQGGDNSDVPVFVGSLGITNNANVSCLHLVICYCFDLSNVPYSAQTAMTLHGAVLQATVHVLCCCHAQTAYVT